MHLTTEILSLSLIVLCVTSTTPKWRKWLPVATDISALSNFSPRSLRVASAVLCYAHASSLDEPANVACYKDRECHVAQVDTELAVHESSDWSCYQSPVCYSPEGEQFLFKLRSRDPTCENLLYSMTCSVAGILYQLISVEAANRLEKCDAPFTQTDYGCVMAVTNIRLSSCDARFACNKLGADLASPRSLEEVQMLSSWIIKEYGTTHQYWVGAYYRKQNDAAWQFTKDGSHFGINSSVWMAGDPNGYLHGSYCARLALNVSTYLLADKGCTTNYQFVCEVTV